MARFRISGVFPASRATVWDLLLRHGDEATIRRIHPAVRTQRVVAAAGDAGPGPGTFEGTVEVERTLRVLGRRHPSRWALDLDPPDRLSVRLLTDAGPLVAGSHWTNTYLEDPKGTRIVTEGAIAFRGVPRLLEPLLIRFMLWRIDREDRRYLRTRMG